MKRKLKKTIGIVLLVTLVVLEVVFYRPPFNLDRIPLNLDSAPVDNELYYNRIMIGTLTIDDLEQAEPQADSDKALLAILRKELSGDYAKDSDFYRALGKIDTTEASQDVLDLAYSCFYTKAVPDQNDEAVQAFFESLSGQRVGKSKTYLHKMMISGKRYADALVAKATGLLPTFPKKGSSQEAYQAYTDNWNKLMTSGQLATIDSKLDKGGLLASLFNSAYVRKIGISGYQPFMTETQMVNLRGDDEEYSWEIANHTKKGAERIIGSFEGSQFTVNDWTEVSDSLDKSRHWLQEAINDILMIVSPLSQPMEDYIISDMESILLQADLEAILFNAGGFGYNSIDYYDGKSIFKYTLDYNLGASLAKYDMNENGLRAYVYRENGGVQTEHFSDKDPVESIKENISDGFKAVTQFDAFMENNEVNGSLTSRSVKVAKKDIADYLAGHGRQKFENFGASNIIDFMENDLSLDAGNIEYQPNGRRFYITDYSDYAAHTFRYNIYLGVNKE